MVPALDGGVCLVFGVRRALVPSSSEGCCPKPGPGGWWGRAGRSSASSALDVLFSGPDPKALRASRKKICYGSVKCFFCLRMTKEEIAARRKVQLDLAWRDLVEETNLRDRLSLLSQLRTEARAFYYAAEDWLAKEKPAQYNLRDALIRHGSPYRKTE